MVYRQILHELLATTSGAFAAIFLDYEGETVDLVCERDVSDHGLRIVGAYQGIFLSVLREMCAKARIGTLQHFKIDFERMTVLSSEIKDGYYVVLLLDARPPNEGMAWHQLETCKQKLIAEM